MLRARRFIAATLLTAGAVELAGLCFLHSAQPVSSGPTTAPSTEPAKPSSWDIPALVSPITLTPAADPAIAKLIDAHNANQARIASIILTAQCTWTLDTKGEPRPMSIRYARQGEKAEMTCGNDRCSSEMGHVKMAPGSALNVDALYLLLFRKYDGGQFKLARPDKPGVVRAASARETLDFDAVTGRLVRVQIQAKEGLIIATFARHEPLLKNAPDALIPRSIEIEVPSDLYPFYRAADGRIALQIESGNAAN